MVIIFISTLTQQTPSKTPNINCMYKNNAAYKNNIIV